MVVEAAAAAGILVHPAALIPLRTTINSKLKMGFFTNSAPMNINPVFSPIVAAASSSSSSCITSSTSPSAVEARLSLVAALASQAFSLSQKLASGAVAELPKYLLPKRMEAQNLEELFMSVPDLETVKYKVLKRTELYEIRAVEPYFVAETTLPGKTGFDFYASSRGFNILAEYLFGKNEASESREMTTPVYVEKSQSSGEKMEMTTPVITRASEDQDSWRMSFVMPSKYGSKLPTPKDPSVRIKEVPSRTVAVAAFPGFVTDEEVKQRELKLRDALKNDVVYQVKENAAVEVAQFNPPFTVPFMRRNEVALEIELRGK